MMDEHDLQALTTTRKGEAWAAPRSVTCFIREGFIFLSPRFEAHS